MGTARAAFIVDDECLDRFHGIWKAWPKPASGLVFPVHILRNRFPNTGGQPGHLAMGAAQAATSDALRAGAILYSSCVRCSAG